MRLVWVLQAFFIAAQSLRGPLRPAAAPKLFYKGVLEGHGPSGPPSDSQSTQLLSNYAVLGTALPLAALAFPWLLGQITDFTVAASDRQQSILELLLLKRVYLYSTALVCLDWCAKRSVELAATPLGERFLKINKELLGEGIAGSEEQRQVFESLNKVSGQQQALAIPLLVAAALLASFALVTATSSLSPSSSASSAAFIAPAQAIAALSLISNGAVALLFSKTEIGHALGDKSTASASASASASTLAAAVLVGLSLVGGNGGATWPVQNLVNAFIAVTVCRACALPKFGQVVLALLGLVLYDVVAVAGTVQFTDSGQSIMEAVARAKISASAVSASASASASAPASLAANSVSAAVGSAGWSMWRPGLFEVVVGGRVSDALGLADVVFPALLAGWALRFDAASSSPSNAPSPLQDGREAATATATAATTAGAATTTSLYPASLAGFALGCVACELLQTGTGGQPALLFLVPSMLFAVLTQAALSGPGVFRRALEN